VRAMVLRQPGHPVEAQELPDPQASSPGSVIDVVACGICHSDLHAAAGDYPTNLPIILGHEVVGQHPDLGPVLVYACWGCREPNCWACSSGQEMICPNATEAGLFRDGGYAEKMAIPDDAYLVPIGDLDPYRTAPLACGGLTAYRAVDHTLDRLASIAKPRALVLGAGGLGQFGIQFLKIRSDASVTVVDSSAGKRDVALRMGADEVCDSVDLEGTFDAVIDFVGAAATLEAMAQHVARQGIAVVVGLYGGTIPFGFGAVPHEARFMTSVWGTRAQLGELVELARTHPLNSPVEVLPLQSAQHSLDRLAAGDVSGRLVLDPRRTA
jgi:propanol-preferring alcohol dehydrogenase